MGQSISSIKEEAQKQNAENEKLANDALNSLLEVAMAKSDLFYAKVLSSGNGDKLVPIKKIIRQVNFYKAAVSEDSSDFAKALTDTISEFASGSFIAGINSLVTTAIKVLFGSYSGNMSQQQSYLIAIGPMGGVVRIDYFLYSYRFTSDTLIKIVKNVLLVNVVVSSMDLTSLDLNTVRVILQGTYTDLTKDQVDKMCQEVIQEIQNSNSKNTAPQRTALLECGRFDHRPTNQHQPQQKSDEVLAQSYQEQNDAMKSLRDYYENYHNYIYGRDAIIYRDIFEAKDKGVIKRVGEARYDETRHFQNRWNGQRLIEYGFQDERDGNGARVNIPEEYDTLWVRLSNDGYINFKCSFIDGKKEEVGVFSTGFRFLNQLAPDGATQDTHWNHHGWVPVPVGRSGSVVLVSKGESELWISGVAFSKNMWKIASNSAYAYTKAFNGGDTFKLSDPWQNDQLGVIESGRVYKLKVPVVPSNNDKLLYFVEHNNNWDGFNHTKITVNGVEIERLRTSYDNPLARHYNSKIYSRYGAARIPSSLIKKDDRFVEVAINMSEQNQSFYFREAGTHDYILPTTLNSS